MKTKIVTMSMGEMASAQAVGILRRNECIREHTQSGNSSKKYHAGNVWDTDIESCGAEAVFCKYKNLYWAATVNTFKEADVLDNIQIRHTVLDYGSLIVRKRDDLNDFFVLVTGRMPDYKVVGFLSGHDAAQDKWWTNPKGKEAAWFVPQEALMDVDLLCCNVGNTAISPSRESQKSVETETQERDFLEV